MWPGCSLIKAAKLPQLLNGVYTGRMAVRKDYVVGIAPDRSKFEERDGLELVRLEIK